jgi:hypothetical protein
MPKLTTRLFVALITFIIGVSATSAWLVSRLTEQETRLILPRASWEHIYFREINAVTNLSGLTELRKTDVADGDVEVRIWWGFGLSPLGGIVLKRTSGQWSAIHLKADNYSEPQRAERKELRPPKSGWDAVWQRLVNARILTLPDASEIGCDVGGLDGMAFVVETNNDRTYRTYRYDQPTYARCDEARQMVEISEIIADEFDFHDSQN